LSSPAALSEWYFGDIASCQAGIAEVISLTRELNDSNARALALYIAALAGNLERDPVDVERVASDLIELSTIQNFAHWLALGTILRGWAHSALGHITEGIAQIEDGIEDYRRNGSIIDLPYLLSLKAEALHLADRTVEALETIREAERLVERSEARWWCAELHRLRGVFLAALGAKESEIETSFDTAIRIAKQQRSISLLRRAEASLTEFHSQSGRKNEDRDATDTATPLSLQSTSPHKPAAASCRPAKLGPRKISVSRLPVTGSHIFGREEDIAFLDAAWANQQINVVTIVAWAGVGKSTLVNHWLRRLAAEQYRSAHLVFGWSFYRQGTSGGTSSTDEFIDAALRWFGDPDPRIGTAWEKGERLARLIARRRTLLILDGLEPLQNPPGPQEGRLRDPSLQALLRELAAFNTGLCVITTRTPVADIADHERTSAVRRDLEQLSSEAGAKLLRALGVKGHEAELRTASGEFGGHCLALTLLGSYLTDAYNGDIRCRKEVSERLAQDVRQGVHARKIMESYQTWFGEDPELSVLRMLGLFDRPADEKALAALLKSPAIPGLTESIADLSPTEWRTILARLRRARLLAGEDVHNPGHLDAHPLVREYFGEQLRSQGADAWKESNRRLYNHYRTLAPQLPDSFREMEPLFLAVICGCNAGLFHEALHEVYIPRIQRGNASFAANVLGARGALLSMLAHFFEQGRWGSPVETGVERHSLTADDQLFILIQTALYLTSARESTPEIRICYERAESLCHSLGRPLLLYVALIGRWRYSLCTDTLTTTMQVAKRVYSLAQEQNDSTLMIGAHTALAATLYYFGDFETARQHTKRGVQIWRSGGVRVPFEEVDAQPVACLCHDALFEWHFGEIVSCRATMAEAITLAKELNDMHGLAVALYCLAVLAYFERNAPEVEHLSSDLIELSTRHNFAHFLATGTVYRGWARSALGDTAEGILTIEDGIENYRTIGSMLLMPLFLALKAEGLHLANRTPEALDAIREAEALVERFEWRWWCAELYRLRGVFLAAIGADETQIEASFCAAIRTAKKQKSVSLEKRSEATYAEYRRQKESRSAGHVFRLPLC
jgi:predicted ATPase